MEDVAFEFVLEGRVRFGFVGSGTGVLPVEELV